MRPLLDVSDTAVLFKVSRRTVYTKAWRRRVGLPAYRIGGVLRFRIDDVEKVLDFTREDDVPRRSLGVSRPATGPVGGVRT